MKINLKQFVRILANFLVPTPQTVRRHRAPSARFVTLEARAASRGETLARDGRSYTLCTSDLRVLEFDNLAQVKAFLDGVDFKLNEADRADASLVFPHPPGGIYKVGKLSPAVAQGDVYDIDKTPERYNILSDGTMKPGPAADVGSSGKFVPFVPVPVAPIAKE